MNSPIIYSELGNAVNFSVPDGGMTVWTEFEKSINLERVVPKAYNKGLYFSAGKLHQYPTYNTNGIRLGFASSTKENLTKSVDILKGLI